MLYALGLGFGQDPMDRGALRFVYEKDAAGRADHGHGDGLARHLVARPAHRRRCRSSWCTASRTCACCARCRPSGTLVARNRVVSLTDKGAGKGAIAVVLRTLIDEASGETVAESRNVTFLRGDGGFSADERRIAIPGPSRCRPCPSARPTSR